MKRQFLKHGYLASREKERIQKTFESTFWYENALLDFIAAYGLVNKRGPTDSVLARVGLVPRERLPMLLQRLIDEGWVTFYGNGHNHYEAAVIL